MARTITPMSCMIFFSLAMCRGVVGDPEGDGSASDAIRSDIEKEHVGLEMLQKRSLQRVKASEGTRSSEASAGAATEAIASAATARQHALVEQADIHEQMSEAELGILRTKLRAGLYQGLSQCVLDDDGAGAKASICEQGYLQVASLCCNYQMELFVVRVITSMGLKVCMQGGVMGLVPWFTCGNFQSLGLLKEAIERGTGDETPCPFVGKISEDCPEWSAKCWNETAGNENQGYHRRRVCSTGNDKGAGSSWTHKPQFDSGSGGGGGGGGGTTIIYGKPGSGANVITIYNVPPRPSPAPIPVPEPQPCNCGCMATFQLMAGTNILQATITGKSEKQLDEICCGECSRHDDCQFWVRQYHEDGRYLNKPAICWLRKNAAGESYNMAYRGGWKTPPACYKPRPAGACVMSFQEFSGSNIPNGKIGVCGADDEALDAACHQACVNHRDCTHWFRDADPRGIAACQLRYNPGSEYTYRPHVRGGWKQGCGHFEKCDATFQDKGGRQVARMGVYGNDNNQLDAACCHLCALNRECEYWVREWGEQGNRVCYLRSTGGGYSWSWTKRGGWNKVCTHDDVPERFATFQELAGILVATERVCGHTNRELDTECSAKCQADSLCQYWIRERGHEGFLYCWLRKFNTKPTKSASANRRGGYREQQQCGSAYVNNSCRASFQHLAGTQVALEFVCGNSDEELDAMCCHLCRNTTGCQFWVRETRKATDTDHRPKQCWLRKNPGGYSKHVSYVGGWVQGCGRDEEDCKSTFQERGGPQVEIVGVCGNTSDARYLDKACCQKCAENPACEFWVRDTNYPLAAHGGENNSRCYLRKLGALNPSVNVNKRGGWNKICGEPNVEKCDSAFQDMAGSQLLQTRVCGRSNADLDAQCCNKCKENEFCEYWVREKSDKGYVYCWLRTYDNPNRVPNSNANRRGGFRVDAKCGDAYLDNGCRATFKEMSGSQVALEFVCGDTDDELDAMCCEKCRNNTQCEFWVREVRDKDKEKDITRPKTCWLRKNAGSGSNNKLRRGGWRQGCDGKFSKCAATFQERSGAQVAKVGVCGADPYSKKKEEKEKLDSACCDLCAKHPDCEFWVREVDLPTKAQAGENTSFCYLRKNGAAASAASTTKRGGWNKICGDTKATRCRSAFQDLAGSLVDTTRVCGHNDTALDSQCCHKCKQHDFCDHWVREKGAKGWVTCWLRATHPNPAVKPNANVNRRGGYKEEPKCGDAYLDNNCTSSFDEMSGTQVALEYVCGKTDEELDAMCCHLCRNNTDCEFWVRERRLTWEEDTTRPKICWLRKNPGGASKNLYRRGGWKRGCGYEVEKCWATFQDRGGPLVEKLGVCGSSDRKVLDSMCCDLCAQNPECEFWVRETDIPFKNNTFCYLRKIGAVNPTSRTNKRGGWNKICGDPKLPKRRASFQNMGGGLVETTRICGNSSSQLDRECAAKCLGNEFCEFWLRETHPTYPDEGFKYCWLYRKATSRSASTTRRGGWREQKLCGAAYMKNKCNASFYELSGSQAALVFVCGDSDEELNAMCCDECKNNTRCEFWVRESGSSGVKQCWLRYNPGGFSKNLARRGGFKQGCAGDSELPNCKSQFQDFHGPEVDRFGVCGKTSEELDKACCDLCTNHKDCEFWVREHGTAGQINQGRQPDEGMGTNSKLCWLRKIGSTARANDNRRGGRKKCKSGDLPNCKSSFDNLGGSHIETNRTCGNTEEELDKGCCAKCEANPACEFWLREAGTAGGHTGYKYCWLYKNPHAYPSKNVNRRGGFKKQELPPCTAAFKDMNGRQIAAMKVFGETDAILDAACCQQCTMNDMCEFWVREYHNPNLIAGGKWCWLRTKYPNSVKQNANTRRGGMKQPGLLQQTVERVTIHTKALQTHELEQGEHSNSTQEPTSDVPKDEETWQFEAEAVFNEDVPEGAEVDTEQKRIHALEDAERRHNNKAEEVMAEHKALSKYIEDRANQEGKTAFLDENGYQSVANLKKNDQMADFVRRAARMLGLKIEDEGGLQGFVPFYSGDQDRQTFEHMLLEMEQVAHGEANNTWLIAGTD